MRSIRDLLLLLFLSLASCAIAHKVVVYGQSPAPFANAVAQAGDTLLPATALPGEAGLIVVITPFGKDTGERKALAAAISERVRQGATLIVSLGASADQAKELEALLPVNCWSFDVASKGGLRRGGSGAVERPDFHVSARYDLHLPYAAIEAGEHRYQWERYGKELLNTDWQVTLTGDQEGRLPLEVAGRYGAGRVRILAYDMNDPLLIANLGYAKYFGDMLTKEAPAFPPIPDMPPLAGISVRIARHQIGKMQVEVRNDGNTPMETVLVYKVRNGEHALLNSASTPVKVPAKGSVTVPLVERSPLLGEAAIAASADRALPYRYIDAGLALASRTGLIAQASALVDTSPAVTLELAGEDVRGFDDMKSWPDRRNGPGKDMAGGAPIYRYVYFTGSTPQVTVSVRNGLHNIAPLARGADLQWPENPTVEGLNDLAFSHGSLRDWKPTRYGVWSGKSAATQQLGLSWDAPVLLAGQTLIGQTDYRRWDRSNPRQYTLAAGEKTLAEVKDAAYTAARRTDSFAPMLTSNCKLSIGGLDANANIEPRTVAPANCTLTEWEVLGWPEAQAPPAATGELTVTATDLLTGKKETLLTEQVTVAGLAEAVRTVKLPSRQTFGPVSITAAFSTGGKNIAISSFDVLFIPPDRDAIIATTTLGQSEMGLLCSPGFIVFDDFGLGTNDDTQGWGGDDDKIWALTHDFMELGTRATDNPARLFTTSARFCHYTCPWRDFPDGQYFWDFATDKLEEMVTSGRYKGTKTLRVFLSDRWNGIPVGATFTWADYIRFDEYLRAKGGNGLQGRSRKELAAEITEKYADQWQTWQMNRYADALLRTKERLAKRGVDFSVTTHGSFPLAGGELGAKLAQTHKASGTDLFWELRNEDLYFSLGMRFGLVAANPDWESGGYNEWGWVSAVLSNPHWFSETGTVEPSRRQWYSTYFAGRVTSKGEFKPLTTYGYDAQGGFGVKNTVNDWQQYQRTMQFTTRVRPEAPVGFGLVVSWREQERRMGTKAGPLGFGLYAAAGEDQVDSLGGEVYQKLVKNGVPIAFVASTHTLRNWKGTQPLIVVDAYGLEPWEIAELDRLNRAGTPIIGIGAGIGDGTPEAAQLFGVTRAETFTGGTGVMVKTLSPATSAFIARRAGRAPTLFCPASGKALTVEEAQQLAVQVIEVTGKPVSASPGVAVTPFISNGCLFLTLNDQGDMNRTISVEIAPALLKADFTGKNLRVIDMDNAVEIPAQWDGNRLRFSLPVAASDGRLVMISNDGI